MLIGHEKQREFLQKSTEANKLSRAYLFAGSEHLGKRKMALVWAAQLLNCDLEKSQPPDLIFVEPVAKEIKIEQIRNLIWKLSLKPYSAPFKIAVIDSAQSMNQEAQNCFLKTLEEPKEKNLIILIAEHPEMLLPTIVSRCEKISFYPVKKQAIEEYLGGQRIPAEKIKKIADIASGRPGVAVEFIEKPEKLDEYQEKIKEIAKVANADLSYRFQYAKDLAEAPDLLEDLNLWLVYFRNILLAKCLTSQDASLRYSLAKLKNILKLMEKIIFLIANTNANPKLALEIIMLSI